ncbi:MAG TPA: DsbA family oxidoreductase [Propionibacteriaceae bacterium]|nr:DsbA family oxidoreductase [Propionibacteriaceae bacterium]
MRIDIWSDIACPWCYIGLARFDRVLAAFPHADEVDVTLHSFQLDPTLPESYDGTETQYLAESKGLPEAQVREMFSHVQSAAAPEELRLDFDTIKVANSRRAHRLLHAAQDADPSGRTAWALEAALFKAHFTDGETISDTDTLVRLAASVGLDEDLARDAVDSDILDLEVAADIQEAASYGIRGVPFFVFEEKYGISGAQPAEVFEGALAQVWDELHPVEPARSLITVPGAADAEACGPEGCD